MLSWNEIRSRAIKFPRDWKGTTSEKSERQIFWNEFFDIFGIGRRTIAAKEAAGTLITPPGLPLPKEDHAAFIKEDCILHRASVARRKPRSGRRRDRSSVHSRARAPLAGFR